MDIRCCSRDVFVHFPCRHGKFVFKFIRTLPYMKLCPQKVITDVKLGCMKISETDSPLIPKFRVKSLNSICSPVFLACFSSRFVELRFVSRTERLRSLFRWQPSKIVDILHFSMATCVAFEDLRA